MSLDRKTICLIIVVVGFILYKNPHLSLVAILFSLIAFTCYFIEDTLLPKIDKLLVLKFNATANILVVIAILIYIAGVGLSGFVGYKLTAGMANTKFKHQEKFFLNEIRDGQYSHWGYYKKGYEEFN